MREKSLSKLLSAAELRGGGMNKLVLQNILWKFNLVYHLEEKKCQKF